MSLIQYKRSIFADVSLWFLVFSNFVSLFLATKDGSNLSTLMWVYWFQSITIGFFNFVRIIQLKEFSTEGLLINNRPALPTQSTKIFTAFFFLFHYGLFHLGYFMMLLSGVITKSNGQNLASPESKTVVAAAFVFFINHLFSHFYNRPRDTKKQNIGSLMFYPYARIIPMHLTALFASSFVGPLYSFLILKTLADATMHIVEHNVIRKGEE